MDEKSSDILIWKSKGSEIQITTLKGLFDALLNISQEDIDSVIGLNISKEENKVLEWLESNFPRQMELAIHLKNIHEFTPQQIREQLIRDLRKIIE
jgi:predicted component of type VI protein secretion system